MLTHEQLKQKALSDPKVKDAYDELEKDFGIVEKLIVARVKAGLTMQQVADKLGVTKARISKFESMQNSPTLKTLMSYAEAIGFRLELKLVSLARPTKTKVKTAKLPAQKSDNVIQLRTEDLKRAGARYASSGRYAAVAKKRTATTSTKAKARPAAKASAKKPTTHRKK